MTINFDTTSRMKNCKNCGKTFETKRASQLYCGVECGKQVQKRKTEEYYINSVLRSCKTDAERKTKLEELRIKREEKRRRKCNKIPESYGPKPYERTPYQRKKTVKRNCLRCQQVFDSKGPGNRLCVECNSANSTNSGPREYRVVVEKKRGIG